MNAILFHDVHAPSGGYSDDDYRALASIFDTQIWPTLTRHFGRPHDIDRNGRILIFFTSAVNELSPPGSDQYVGGVFASRDLFPKKDSGRLGGCPGSNEAEMIYMIVPDPNGEINGNVRTREQELARAPKVLAHELHHLINASRRLHGGGRVPSSWNETIWLNEGLSHAAEEMVAYAATGLSSRENLDAERIAMTPGAEEALSLLQYPNLHNAARYLDDPPAHSPTGPDGLATRGATWQFLRYAADRRGGAESDFWNGLIRPGRTGLDNLEVSLGDDPLAWMHDWLVSAYVDDHVVGTPARYQQPSWNLRRLYPFLRMPSGEAYGRYPLTTYSLTNGAPVALEIAPTSGAHVAFSVPPNETAEVRANGGSTSCRAGGPTVQIDRGQVVHLLSDAIESFCVDGTSTGAEFVLVPFNGSSSASLHLTLEGEGLGVAPAAKQDARSATDVHSTDPVADWERTFRAAERRELSRLVPGSPDTPIEAPRASARSSSSGLRMALVRVH